MKYRLLAAMLGFLIVASLTSLSAAEDITDWGFGKVASVDTSSNKILVSEYDFENDSEMTVAYAVNGANF